MTTPLPQTPGDQREDHAAAAGAAVAAIYEQAELVIIAAIATLSRKVASGTMAPKVAATRLRQTVTQTLSNAAPRIRQALGTAMQGASQQARAMITSPAPTPPGPVSIMPARTADLGRWTQPLAQLLDQAGDNAIQAADNGLASVVAAVSQVTETGPAEASAAVVRASLGLARVGLPPVQPPASPYQTAIGNAFGQYAGWPGQSLSYRRIQAAQEALDELAGKGITGFTDKAGRRWDLATYVEMATRTGVSNAWDDMQAQAAIRTGLDLVETGTHSSEGSCPLCIPWLNRKLSLTGATPGYPTVDEAKAAGWRHPNCRCFWTVIGGYMTDVTNPVDLADAASVYKASQRQRALERNVRAAGRRAQAAVTPQAKTRARHELANARAASAAHRHATKLRMMKVTVKRRERPFGPRLAGGRDERNGADPGRHRLHPDTLRAAQPR